MVDVQQDGNAHLLIDVNEVLHHLLGGHRVEGGDRLVRQNDVGALGQRPRQRHALLLAAGELVGAHIRLIENAHLVQRLERLELVLFAERAQQHAPEGHIRHAGGEHILDHSRARDQIERLEHHADAPAELPQRLAGQGAHIRAVHRQRAGGDPVHTVHRPQQRGLAGAGAADDGDKFAVPNGQVHIVKAHGAVGIYLGYMVKYDHTVSSSS